MGETPRQRAKREKKAYIRLIIDTRHSEPGGWLHDYEGPHDAGSVSIAREALLALIKQMGGRNG